MDEQTLVLVLSINIIIMAILIIFIAIYNKFQNNIIAINEAEASIDSELRKRFDLLNKSVKVIKSYIGHEKEVLEDVVKLRSRRLTSLELDTELNESIKQFYALSEEYADLKASDNFLKLLESITEVEEHLSGCRKFYNHKVATYNKQVRRFPSNIIAKLFKYKLKPYFEVKEKDNSLKGL